MVHIYDSDMYCKSEGWNEDSLASNHKCDLAAEEYAQKKMKKFGLNFKVSSSSLQLRKPYIYSFIFVTGTITNKGNQKATVKVNTRVPTCEFGGASIDHLEL